jgi:hypothetical protein
MGSQHPPTSSTSNIGTWIWWSVAMVFAALFVGLGAAVLDVAAGASLPHAASTGAAAAAGLATLWCVVTGVALAARRG